jgi:hypothetical protein
VALSASSSVASSSAAAAASSDQIRIDGLGDAGDEVDMAQCRAHARALLSSR